MFCPNYKNKQVFDGFNEMIEAFGGKPMTEEEFRSPELRKQRSGRDYSAMEAAYITYDRNGGYFLDETPQGKPSLLFQTLLSHFGDRSAAIVAKSNVYSDEFLNWFGQWIGPAQGIQDEDIDFGEISKVVDENGEPLVVWHNSKGKLITEYDMNRVGTNGGRLYGPGIYTSTAREYNSTFGNIENAWYVNIKRPFNQSYDLEKYENTEEQDLFIEQTQNARLVEDIPEEFRSKYDGTIADDEDHFEYVAWHPNNIKSVQNLGTFNPDNANVYHLKRDVLVDEDVEYFHQTSLVDSFGQSLSERLIAGETVSSSELMNYMLLGGIFSSMDKPLAEALSSHDIPVRIGREMKDGELAKVVTENGGSVIFINQNELQLVSRGYAGISIEHEIVHALTVDIINNPTTEEDFSFVEANRKALRLITKNIKHLDVHSRNVVDGMYALTNEKEFAACFASDPNVRAQIYQLAEKIDRIHRNRNIVSYLKSLVNKIVKAFGKKAVFNEKSAVSQIQEYENRLTDFLMNRPQIVEGNISPTSRLRAVYNKIDRSVLNHEQFIEEMKMLERMQSAEKNSLILNQPEPTLERGRARMHNYDEVVQALKTRIDALRASTLDSIVKGRLISTTDTQMQMFIVDEFGKYLAIQNLLRTSVPYIIETVDKLRAIRRDEGRFTNTDYMYQMHANIGMYNAVFNNLSSIIENKDDAQRMIDEYNARNTDKISMEDILAIKQNLENAKAFTNQASTVLELMLKENVQYTLRKIAKETGNPDIEAYIKVMDSTDSSMFIDDISIFETVVGSSDQSANEAVRALSYMINKALNKAMWDANDRAEELLKLQKELKRGEKGWHLYEKDNDGNFTGYLIRDLNFGQFQKDYDAFIRSLNKVLINQFGLTDLAEDNRVSPDGLDGKREAIITENGRQVKYTAKEYFEQKRDEWLSTHCERKYMPKYYKYYSKLPQRVKDNLARIRTEIQAITTNYKDLYDENGVPHYEKLSKEDWIKLNVLWERRRFLSKDIDEYGNKKEGQDLEDARLLAEMYKELYGVDENGNEKKSEKKYYKEQWLAERNRIIEQFGADSKELEEWDERNTRKTLKKNEFGEALVFIEIEKEFGDQSVSGEYGPKYKQLKEERNQLLNNFRMPNGDIDINNMPQVIKNAINELNRKMIAESKKVRAQDAGLQQRAAKYNEIFQKYIKYVDSIQLKQAKEVAHQQAIIKAQQEEDDLFALSAEEFENIILAQSGYGYVITDDDLLDMDDPGTFVPYSWLQRIETYDENFMEFEPNDAWIDKSESDLLNHNFDESYNTPLVPKRSIYDNSEEYNKVMGSETLKALYECVQRTIKESNDMQGREFSDDFLLPQVECTALERLARKSTWKSLSEWIKRLFGFGRIVGLDDDPNDMEQPIVENQLSEGRTDTSISGTYPDGRDFHMIPSYFTRKLEHPDLISKDIVDITRRYYEMSCKYKERSLIRDDCEAIIDMLKKQKFKSGDITSKKRKRVLKLIGGNEKESNTYNYAKSIAERDLYDMQRITFGTGTFGVAASKIMQLWKRYTTARNLGMNPKVALVGFFTSMFAHLVNGCVGYKYGWKEMNRATWIVLKEFGVNLFGTRFIGQRLTKNKLMLLLEFLDMSDQSTRKTEHSNRNRILQALYKNSTFGLMSACDIYSKSTIAVATLLSYRLVDGKFMTKHMIEESKLTLGEEEYNRLMKEFKDSKVTAYDAIDGDTSLKDGQINSGETKLKVKDEYKDAWEQIKYTASQKALKNAEQADGMATRLQKAMMTRNFIGAFVLIHRQYIPLMLQQTFGKRIYDNDAQEYRGGQFRTMFDFVNRLCASNMLAGVGAGAFLGVAFGGFSPFSIIGCSTLALAWSIYQKSRLKIKGEKAKTLKETWNDFFHNAETTQEHAQKTANKYQIKQTILEVLLINCAVAPMANLICACADNTDKDDDRLKYLLLQTLAYWARATQFEVNVKYNFVDLLNNIKSASAATAVSDSVLDMFSATGTSSQWWGNFFTGLAKSTFSNTLGYGRNINASTITGEIYETYSSDSDEDDDIVKNSPAYEGWHKWEKALWKMLPVHNVTEQALNPQAKRRYQENQVMRMTKEDKESVLYEPLCNLYDWIFGK